MLAVNVVSQPVLLCRLPWRSKLTFQIAPRAVMVSPLRIALLVPRADAAACVRRLHAEFVERS